MILLSKAYDTILPSKAFGKILLSKTFGTILPSKAFGKILLSKTFDTILPSKAFVGSTCLNLKVDPYQQQIDTFDAVVNYVPEMLTQKNYPVYTGNGYIAASYDSQNGLYIRLNRALSQPVPYYPVINVNIDDTTKEEVDVLQIKQGLANRIQVFNTKSGCVTIESCLYAHRSHPSLMVQEIKLYNPTKSTLNVELDQILSSGWTGAQTTKHRYKMLTVLTTVQYTKAGYLDDVNLQLTDLSTKCQEEMKTALHTQPTVLKSEHTSLWEKIWLSGFSLSISRAAGVQNGDKINSTMYYVLSNVLAPLHDPRTSKEVSLELKKTLHYPDKCYSGPTTIHSSTLWIDPDDEDSIARIVTTWIITLEKQGCQRMIAAGVDGVLQAMLLSIGSLQFGNEHLEMKLHPEDTHRDFNFHRINYGNNTHLNISVLVGEDNKANIFVSLDRNDKPYYACDAGCLDPPTQLSKTRSKFPVKLTEPLTAILYITADKIHMEEYKHAIHVKEIVEAPAHEHHVIALHKHGHHFGGLPTFFWISIAFLIIVFHLFLFKLIYNEYCQAQERFTKSRYNV
ncbi:hypothetical protein ACF0H5_016409 [Mactra antiquata]